MRRPWDMVLAIIAGVAVVHVAHTVPVVRDYMMYLNSLGMGH